MGKFYDISGLKFGRLTVIKRVPNISTRTTRWLCRCDCGKLIESNKNNLINGHSKSCGCLATELKFNRKTRTKHNQSYNRIYHTWQSMKQRCEDKNSPGYYLYGAKGIAVCEEWHDFEKFYAWALINGYTDSLTIDRIDNNLGYEPNNCRWITMKEQNRNKTNNRKIKISGIEKCFSEWCEIFGIPKSTVMNRLRRGCSIDEAFNVTYRRRKTKRPEEIKSMMEAWK